MDKFPDILNVSNKTNFDNLFFSHCLSLLREELMTMMIKGDESTFYDIDTFNRKHVNDAKKTEKMVEMMISELTELGWNTFLGFGGTGLYIYSTEEKPIGAY